MVGRLLLCGMLVGALAGLFAFGFSHAFGAGQIDQAIALEELANGTHTHGAPEHADGFATEPFNRQTQAGVGLLAGLVIFGAALGGVFSMVFVGLHGRFGPKKPLNLAIGIAIFGFLTLFFIPNLKYPANPPGTSLAETINERTILFFGMIAVSAIALTIACLVASRLANYGSLRAIVAGLVTYTVCVVLSWVALPSINEAPEGFPQALLLEFRLTSLGLHAVIWTTLGVVFGMLAGRNMRSSIA